MSTHNQRLEKVLRIKMNGPPVDKCCQVCQIVQRHGRRPYLGVADKRQCRRYSCDLCDEGFQRKYFLLHHVLITHENRIKNCRKCESRSYFYLTPNFVSKKIQ